MPETFEEVLRAAEGIDATRADPSGLVECRIRPRSNKKAASKKPRGRIISARLPGFHGWGSADLGRIVLIEDAKLRADLEAKRQAMIDRGDEPCQRCGDWHPVIPNPYREVRRIRVRGLDGHPMDAEEIVTLSRVSIDIDSLHPELKEEVEGDRKGYVGPFRAKLQRHLDDYTFDQVRPIQEDEYDVVVAPPVDSETVTRDVSRLNETALRRSLESRSGTEPFIDLASTAVVESVRG